MTSIDNKEVVARMRQACNAERDVDLATFINSTSSAVSSWKNTKNPPFKACFNVSQKTGVSQEWLLTGKASHDKNIDSNNALIKNTAMPREAFVNKFIAIVNIGRRTGVLPRPENVLDIEIERLGNTLYEETIGLDPQVLFDVEDYLDTQGEDG